MLISYYANKKSSPRLPLWQPSLISFNTPIDSGSIIKPCTLKHFQVPILAPGLFGVYSGFIVVTDTYAMGIGNRKFWKLARETSHTIRLKIKYGEHVQFNRLDFGPERLIDIQCKLTAMVRNDAHGAGRTESNVLFSNVGNCPHLALNSDVVQHLANFTAVSAHNMGASFSIYITTFNGKMFWTLNYFENVVSEEVAQSFIELINNILMQQILQ